MKSSAGLLTRRIVPSDVEVEIAVCRIRWHANRLLRPGISSSERLIRLRSILSAARDAYEVEVQQLDSLSFVQADPQTEVPVV